jgi:hypothetical protein
MAKTRRVRKARKSTRKSTRKNKMYRGGNPQEAEYERLYGAWLADKTNKTRFDAVYASLNKLIDDTKSQPKLKELERTKKQLDKWNADWPSAVEIFKGSKRAVLTMAAT